MTETMALNYADKGIRVNAIAPGTIATESNKDLEDETHKQAQLKKIPIERLRKTGRSRRGRRMDGVGRSELRNRNDTFRRRRHDALSVSAGQIKERGKPSLFCLGKDHKGNGSLKNRRAAR